MASSQNAFLRFETKDAVRAGDTFCLQARPKAIFRCEWLESDQYEGIYVLSFGEAAPGHIIHRPFYAYMAHPLSSGWKLSAVMGGTDICLTLHSERELPNGFSCRMIGRAVLEMVDVTS